MTNNSVKLRCIIFGFVIQNLGELLQQFGKVKRSFGNKVALGRAEIRERSQLALKMMDKFGQDLQTGVWFQVQLDGKL